MAKQRRTGGSGFRTPELRGTLGTLVRTTLQQAGALRDALERGAREGRSRIDEARTARRRTEALAELGEIVLDLIRRDEIDLSELPEAADLVRYLDELDADAHSDHDDDDDAHRFAKPAARSRFDTRRPSSRPPPIETDADDGTVSAIGTNPPARPRPRPAQPSPSRVWRPPADDEEDAPKPTPSPPRRDPNRKGGIRFDNSDDDDSDLADYMHPDDVPPKPKPPADGEP